MLKKPMQNTQSKNWTNRLAKINLIYVLFVILWGAWVRLSGSGAGCGEHWPLCNGEVIPIEQSLQTIIEFTHRITSGIFGFTILGMVIMSFKDFSKWHKAQKWSLMALLFTIIEALIGAVLVKKGLVDKNDSIYRAWVVAIHLANTLLLVATIVLAEFYSRFKEVNKYRTPMSAKDKFLYSSLCIIFLIVSASGAVTALGNTLFPEASLVEGMKKDFESGSHFLIRLRVIHPFIATLLSLGLINLALRKVEDRLLKMNSNRLLIGAIIALGFGVINWLMMAPHWGALLHLLIADLLWILFVYQLCFQRYAIPDLNHQNI